LLAAARAAVQYNYSLGITAWLDPLASDYVLRAYKMLADHGELTSQVVAFPQVLAKDPTAELATVQHTREVYKNVPNLHVTGIKVFADGVVEYPSQTAQPQQALQKHRPQRRTPVRSENICRALHRRRQTRINHPRPRHRRWRRQSRARRHRRRPPGQRKFRIAPHPDSRTIRASRRFSPFPRTRRHQRPTTFLGRGQPRHHRNREALRRPEIYKWQYPARSILDNGGIISGASDWPVSTANVFRAIYQAETRKGPEGVLDPSQAMPRDAMFYAYTRNSARAMNLDSIGTIAPGKRADLVLLDRDVLTISAEQMRETKVLWTMVAGKTVYRAK
jgi:predicted amidohydrolase YtcJ